MRYGLWAAVTCLGLSLAAAAASRTDGEEHARRPLLDVLRVGQTVELKSENGGEAFGISIYPQANLDEAHKITAEYRAVCRELEEIRHRQKQEKVTPEQVARFNELEEKQQAIERTGSSPCRIVEIGQDFVAYRYECPASWAEGVFYLPRERVKYVKEPAEQNEPARE